MSKPRKRIVVAVVLTAWFVAGWVLFTGFNPTPSEQFSDWIGARRSPPKIGFLEKTANQRGFRFFAEQRAKADLQLSEDLLDSPDFAFVVASGLDTGRPLPGKLATWPHLEKALSTHLQNPDPQALREALLRSTKEGFSPWELTLARSAVLHKSEDELGNTLEELRRYENRYGLDSSLSASLARVAELYPLPAHQLARLLLSADKDPDTDKWIKRILADRNISPGSAFSQLLQQLKYDPLPQSDWEIVGKLINESGMDHLRKELLTWLLLSPGCESYRAARLPDLKKAITALAMTDQESAREVISEVFHILTEESAVFASDWQIVAGLLADRVAEEENLSNLITAGVGPDFIWIAHKLDKEGLLDRAIVEWGESLTNVWIWIGEFIDRQHYSAVCRVIETSKHDIVAIDSRHDPTSYEKPKVLSYYTGLIDKIVPHTQDPQVKGFIHLVLSMQAADNVKSEADREKAKVEVLKAIQLLNRVEPTSRLLLEQTVLRLVKEDKTIFEAGRPCFDTWRDGTTLDAVIGQIYRGGWEPGKRELEIWKKYAEKVESLDEAPGLKAIIESIRKMPPQDENRRNVASRLRDFLAAPQWDSGGGFDHVELAVWPLKRMIADGDLAGSVDWMFTLVRNYSRRHPEGDDGLLTESFYEELLPSIRVLPSAEAIKWLELVLNEKNSGEFDWPESFSYVIHRDTALKEEEALEIFRSAFVSHPLRSWIVWSLLESAPFESRQERRIVHSRIREMLTGEWQNKVMDAIDEDSINPDDFERDMAEAPAGARRYFLGYHWEQLRRHSTKRDLKEDEILRLLFWQAEQHLELLERNRRFSSHEFEDVFEALLKRKDELKIHPRMQTIVSRLHRVTLDGPRPGMYPSDVKGIANWQARTEHLREGGQSEIDNLLTNEALPVTERAWALVLNNHQPEARRLMEESANDLTFAFSPNTDPNDFLTESVISFPGTFPENSMLRIYCELYLQTRRRGNPYLDRAQGIRQPWPSTAIAFERFEETPGKLARMFEATKFTEKTLEKNIFYTLCQVRGIATLMTTKAETLMSDGSSGESNEDSRDFLADRFHINKLEAQLSLGNLDKTAENLKILETNKPYFGGLNEGLNVLRYHLWRKCILNDELQPEERKLLETLSFEEFPAKVLMGSDHRSYSPLQNQSSLSRMRALHFSLALIEEASAGTPPNSWSNFSGLDYELYRPSWTEKTDFFYHTALVIAARTRDWDEESRWKWMALFQTDPPGSPRGKPIRTFTLFAGTAYISEDEVKRRGRDFALKFPEDGWTFLTLARLGKHYKDDSLAEFGLTGAERYIAADPRIKGELDRLTGPAVRTD